MTARDLWNRYQKYLCLVPSLDLSLDISRMSFDDGFFARMSPALDRAYTDMDGLEHGDIANPDEKRMVGHYWLRDPRRAPTADLTAAIEHTLAEVKSFAAEVHAGRVKPPTAPGFSRVLSIGIGGSALGPMFVADALGQASSDKMQIHFLDNTDPEGIARVLTALQGRLGETLCLVISKSGGTPETRNGMLYARAAYQAARPVLSQAMPWPSPAPAHTWIGKRRPRVGCGGSRCGTGSAAGPVKPAPWACSRRPCRAWTSMLCSPVPPPG